MGLFFLFHPKGNPLFQKGLHLLQIIRQHGLEAVAHQILGLGHIIRDGDFAHLARINAFHKIVIADLVHRLDRRIEKMDQHHAHQGDDQPDGQVLVKFVQGGPHERLKV